MMEAARAAGLACVPDARVSHQAARLAPRFAPARTAEAAFVPSTAMMVDRPVRAGVQVYARGRDLIVNAVVNPGAEVIADGHIHVYASLRGRAIAGAHGDAKARIFVMVMEPELVAIAGVYQTAEAGLLQGVRGRPA